MQSLGFSMALDFIYKGKTCDNELCFDKTMEDCEVSSSFDSDDEIDHTEWIEGTDSYTSNDSNDSRSLSISGQSLESAINLSLFNPIKVCR